MDNLTERLKQSVKLNRGAKVFLHRVSNPEKYGAKVRKNKCIN